MKGGWEKTERSIRSEAVWWCKLTVLLELTERERETEGGRGCESGD